MANHWIQTATRRFPKVFYGWWIVVISLLADACKHGTFNRGFTFYILPIRNELGLGVATISLAEMLGRMEGGILGPVMGHLTDRFGPRVMLAFGGVMSGLGFILLAFTHHFLAFMLIFVGMLSVGFRSGYNNATLPAINRWFYRRRSLAMSIVASGNGLGGAAIAPLVGLMVFALGWRMTAFLSGVGILVIVVPLSFLLRRSPESMGLLPDGDEAPARSRPAGARVEGSSSARGASLPASVHRRQAELDFTAPEAMRTLSYWLLVLATGLRNVVHAGIAFLMAPIVVWFLQGNGRSAEDSLPMAAFFVGLMSFGTFVLTPVLGWMGDRLSKPRLSACCMAVGAISIVMLLNQSGHIWQLTLGVILLAVAESTHHLDWAIMGDYFGRQAFATLRGWQHLPDQLMSMTTPVWMGWIFDRTGSYYWSLLPLVLVYALATCAYWFLRRPYTPVRLRTPVDAPAD